MTRSVSILGSTGSVGVNTVDLILREPEKFPVKAITGNRNIALLAEQARRLGPEFVAIADPSGYLELKAALSGTGVEVAAGPEAIVHAASLPSDWVMAAIVGAAGLAPTLAAIERGAMVGLANKECLVCAGTLLMDRVRRTGATLLPVDSEHSAIFQIFDFDQPQRVERITLTASGGPFRSMGANAMAHVTPEQAVAHPNWSMGAKISVDSATMMNKGLELIEAHHLFGLPEQQIDIVVHPQSVIHSLVSYVDGSVLAQLGTPDMRTPIAVALAWPERMAAPVSRLDLAQVASLTFEAPDPERFPALHLARAALRAGGGAPTILNAANEEAVQAFLGGQIGFLDIARVVQATLSGMPSGSPETIESVIVIDAEARSIARKAIGRLH